MIHEWRLERTGSVYTWGKPFSKGWCLGGMSANGARMALAKEMICSDEDGMDFLERWVTGELHQTVEGILAAENARMRDQIMRQMSQPAPWLNNRGLLAQREWELYNSSGTSTAVDTTVAGVTYPSVWARAKSLLGGSI